MRGYPRGITVGLSLLLGLVLLRGQAGAGDPPTAPMLRLETGMHTGVINRVGLDATQRYLVTGSGDKTVRVWELASGRLLRTLRPPLGAGSEGMIYAVALSPAGSTVAAAGYTGWDWDGTASIYLFDRASGRLRQRIPGLPTAIFHLIYSRDGTFLAVTLGVKQGLRVYRTSDYTEVARDPAYEDVSYWADFDPRGRLVTTSYDGKVRLYERQTFRLLVARQAPGGKQPHGVAFAPDGRRVAVGYVDAPRVDVLAGDDLRPLYSPDITGVTGGNFSRVAWAADGQALYAGGSYSIQGTWLIRRWAAGGQGAVTDLPAAQTWLQHILPLAGGGVVYGAYGSAWGVFDAVDQRQRSVGPPSADFRGITQGFLVSSDGATVQFGFEAGGKAPARFAVRDRTLALMPPSDPTLTAPRTTASGIEITDWRSTPSPKLNGTALTLRAREFSRSLALGPDGQRILLGADWGLYLFNRQGNQQWRVAAPAAVWGVNIPPNGQVAVAAHAGGTIRWYRLRDGQEILAFFPHNDRKRWVLWTPSGYYDAAPGAEELIGWHVNRGRDQAATFFSVSQFRKTYYRPDVVARVLDTFDEAKALRQANAEANRRQKALRVEQSLPPVLEIVTPQDGATVSTSPVTVRVQVRAPADAPVIALKALVDGRPVDQPQRVSLKSPRPDATLHELTVTIPPRDCEVTILAENRHTSSAPVTIRLRWQGTHEAFVIQPKLYVLAIGISRYQRPELALNFAAKDAQDFVQTFRSQHGKLYEDVQAKLLTDADASRDDILRGLEWLERQTTSKDVAVLYFAGHGVNDPNGLYYFLPNAADPMSLKSTSLAATEVKNTVRALAGKVVVFLDTCHSGALMGGKRRTVLDMTGIINELASADSGAVLFAASMGQQYSLEDAKWGNGAFTKAVVEGLSGKADYHKNGRITVSMLELYVAERVKELTGGQQTPTTAKPSAVPDFPLVVLR